MRFGVLGPITVEIDGRAVPLSAPLQRGLLGLLLVNLGQPVPDTRIAEVLWGDDPPRTAKASLHNQILRLRRVLEDADARVIRRANDGYLLTIGRGVLDLAEFRSCAQRGEAAVQAGRWAEAETALSEALAWWRGVPLADVPPAVREAIGVDHLAEAGLQTRELLARTRLMLGRYGQVIGDLGPLVGQHPWRESLSGLMMHALYGAGRQADALTTYRVLRTRLIEELGVEPSAAIRDLLQRILRDDPDLTAPPPARESLDVSKPPAPPIPRQLPTVVEGFAGRAQTLRDLTDLIRPNAAGPQPIVSIIGGAGVGKTTLAVHWSHLIAERFPDGCLYVDLHGFAGGPAPMASEAALRELLHGLGASATQAPDDARRLAALYRSLLAERRMLVVLDNAHDVGQVRPLIPGAPGCLTIVTSRTRLAGLVAVEGARSFRLDPLTTAESLDLLTSRLGESRVHADRESFLALVHACAGLPLALAVVAARLALEPDLEPAALAARLAGERDKLDELHLTDAAGDLRAVFAWSYRSLSTNAAEVFRGLGLHPGPDVSTEAAAALAGLPRPATAAALRELVDGHLLRPLPDDRFQLHDLLRRYAAECAEAEMDAPMLHAARRRLLDCFLRGAEAAQQLTDTEAATAWMDREISVLVALTGLAAEHGFDEHAWQIPPTIAHHLDRRGQWRDLVTVTEIAAAAADRRADLSIRARAHCDAAHARLRTGDLEAAESHLKPARDLCEECGDSAELARVELKLGAVCEARGDLPQALRHSLTALTVTEDDHDGAIRLMALAAAAWFHTLCGQYDDGLARAAEALAGHRRAGQPIGQAHALDTIGLANLRLDRPRAALAAFTEAERIFEACDDRYHRVLALAGIAGAHDALAENDLAREVREHARRLLAELRPSDDDPIHAALHGR